jgi:CheY-like chemotaxis protein
MPVMDGYVATSILREYQKFDTLPIVALTANVTETDIEKFKSYGMQDYLEKPFDVEEFYKMLLQYISPKQSARTEAPRPRKEKKAQAQRKTSGDLGELVGIDVKAGLARLNGNSTVYEKILDKYVDMFENSIATLQGMLKKGEFKQAADYAHNMKGLSGNIGADTIYDIAKELDEACRARSNEALAILKELDKNLTPMIGALKRRKAKSVEEVVEKKMISPAILSDGLNRLHKAAEENKARDAKKICEELSGYTWPDEKREVLQEIINASNAYDFNKAKKLINYLQKS